MSKYIMAGVRFGVSANAAVVVFSVLYGVERFLLDRLVKKAEEKANEERKDTTEKEQDTSDDLK